MTPDERIEALEKRVDELEMTLRMVVAATEESNRLDRMTDDLRGTPAPLPEKVDREFAVILVGALLRPMLAALLPTMRAEALAEGPPAYVLDTYAAALTHAPPKTTAALREAARHAREHALTWDDLGVTA